MASSKATARPRRRVAIAFARNFASGLLQNTEVWFQQEQTTLTDEEIIIAGDELTRLHQRIEATINQEMLALALPQDDDDE